MSKGNSKAKLIFAILFSSVCALALVWSYVHTNWIVTESCAPSFYKGAPLQKPLLELIFRPTYRCSSGL